MNNEGGNGKPLKVRRSFLKRAAAVSLMGLVPAGVRSAAWAAAKPRRCWVFIAIRFCEKLKDIKFINPVVIYFTVVFLGTLFIFILLYSIVAFALKLGGVFVKLV